MATTARPRPTAGRNRDRASGRATRGAGDAEYDLLTAAAIGLAVGAGVALLVSGLRRESPTAMLVRPMKKRMQAAGRRGAKWAARGAEAAAGLVDPEAIRDYLENAREAIDGVVEDEVRDLRRAIKRRRKKLGI